MWDFLGVMMAWLCACGGASLPRLLRPLTRVWRALRSNVCVVDMDHHCPFVANCVGRANMRNFLHFTGWVTLAMVYCCLHTGVLLTGESP